MKMRIHLGEVRRQPHPDLDDGALDSPHTFGDAKDWRTHVPEQIREVWKEMNANERIGVLLMARCLSGSCT